MRRFLPFLMVALVGLMLTGCACQQPAERVPVQAAPVASACPGGPQQYTLVAGVPTAVEYKTGVEEHVRAGLAIPPDAAVCLVSGGSKALIDVIGGVQCALNALVPTITPSARYVYEQPVPVAAPAACRPAAPAATYCAPAPAATYAAPPAVLVIPSPYSVASPPLPSAAPIPVQVVPVAPAAPGCGR